MSERTEELAKRLIMQEEAWHRMLGTCDRELYECRQQRAAAVAKTEAAEQRAARAEAGAGRLREIITARFITVVTQQDGVPCYWWYCNECGRENGHTERCWVGNALADPTGAEALAEVVRLREFVTDARRLYQMTLALAQSGWDNNDCRDEVREALGDIEDALAALDAPAKEASGG